MVLIDDFVAKATRGDRQQLLDKAERVYRGAANRTGRGRLTQKLTPQPTFYCRGLITTTGEDVPMGESLRARIVIVPVAKGSIPIGKPELNKAQAQAKAGLYAEAMAGYVQWLARQDHLDARLTEQQNSLRGEAKGGHSGRPRTSRASRSASRPCCNMPWRWRRSRVSRRRHTGGRGGMPYMDRAMSRRFIWRRRRPSNALRR
jgi:hypothetical protein